MKASMSKLLVAWVLSMLSFVSMAASTPDGALKETTEKMRSLIAENHEAYEADKGQFYAVVDEVLVPRFDVRYIAQLTLGKSWKTANESQRTRFQNAFKNALIRTYADALLANYDTVEVKWEPVRIAPETTDATVRTKAMRSRGAPVNVMFSMREVGDEWKIWDVTIENLSLISNFRSQFNAEIKKSGVDGLITRLEAGDYFRKNPPKAK